MDIADLGRGRGIAAPTQKERLDVITHPSLRDQAIASQAPFLPADYWLPIVGPSQLPSA